MKTEFIHMSDVHLGTEQYGSRERYNDFARAFIDVVEYAISNRVGFVLIGGDLFNRYKVDPLTMNQAYHGLEMLRDAAIPALTIAGNHDRSHYGMGMSWLQFLADRGMLRLLDICATDDGAFELQPWDPDQSEGSYVDIGSVRVYGMRYFGAATARMIETVAPLIAQVPSEGIEYSIMMIHAGMEGYVPHITGGLSEAQVEPLLGKIQYLALGHTHKAYQIPPWIYNPGSIETWTAEESQWDRGFYHVKVDTSCTPQHEVIGPIVPRSRRPWRYIPVRVDGLVTPEELYSAVRGQMLFAARGLTQVDQPVVYVALSGTLAFDRGAIEEGQICEMGLDMLGALLVQVKDRTTPTMFSATSPDGDRIDRGELELQVVRELLEDDARYYSRSADWAKLALQLKEMALEEQNPAAIADHAREVWIRLSGKGETDAD